MGYYQKENNYQRGASTMSPPSAKQQAPVRSGGKESTAAIAEPPRIKPDALVPEQKTDSFVSTQIWNVNGKDKVIDFTSKLVKAYATDFANIHGVGGADHATNSTICVTICDYTKGKGDKSVTLRYCIDVEDMAQLLYAAKLACVGQLGGATPTVPASNDAAAVEQLEFALQQLRSWLKCEPYPDKSRPIPEDGLTAVGKAVAEAANLLKATPNSQSSDVVYSYTRQKNHAYADSISKINGVPHAPVKQIGIFYNPTRRYPWTIQISNYDAPIKQQANGATTHNASKAINKKEAFINLSADDFCAAMVAVDRFIRLWELRMYPILDAGCTRYESVIEEKKNKRA